MHKLGWVRRCPGPAEPVLAKTFLGVFSKVWF